MQRKFFKSSEISKEKKLRDMSINFESLSPSVKMDTFKTVGTCRCCLNTSELTFQMSEVVFDQFYSEKGMINASQSYFDLTGLAEDTVADFSLKICTACKTLLETSYAFRKTCLESHNILMTRIKEEPHEEEIIYESAVEIKLEITDGPSLPVKQRKEKDTSKKSKRRIVKKPTDPTILKSLPLASEEKEGPIDFVSAKFVCMFCDALLKNYAQLIKHRSGHRLHALRDCSMCGEVGCKDFEAHVAMFHPEYKPQKCLSCNAAFINHKELKQHLLTHKSAERYQCVACASNYDSQIALRMHISNHCSAATKDAYRCHVCGLVVGNLVDVQQHLFEKHPKDFRKRYFPCFHCKRILVGAQGGTVCKSCQSWYRSTEKKMTAQNILPQIQCDKCDKKFYDDEAYECHKIAGHTSHAYCFECDQAFWNSAEKRAHNKVVHPVTLMRGHRMCEECGKTFDDFYHLKNHLLVHQGKPQHKCTYPGCKSTAYTSERLAAHIRSAHKKEYKYECHYCGKRINNYGYIFNHFTRAHFPHLRKYACDVTTCTRKFASITDKKRHMATHTGEKLAQITPREQNANPIDEQMMLGGSYPQFSNDFRQF